MKKFIFLLITFLYPAYSQASEQYDFSMNFGLEGAKFNKQLLQDPTLNVMNGDTMFGIVTAININTYNWLIQLNGKLDTFNLQSIMNCVSSSQSLNAAVNKEHFIMDLGANLGYAIKSSTRAELTPFTGLHYRSDTDTHQQASPSLLFDTEVRRSLYVPLGIALNLHFNKDLSLQVAAQYNWLFMGSYQMTHGADTSLDAIQLNSYSPTFSLANGNYKLFCGFTKRFVQGAFGVDNLTVGISAEQFNLAAGPGSPAVPIAYTSSVVSFSIIAGF